MASNLCVALGKVLTLDFNKMASNLCVATFAASEEPPILHYYGLQVVTPATRIMISSLVLKVEKIDVEEFLKETFRTKKADYLSSILWWAVLFTG